MKYAEKIMILNALEAMAEIADCIVCEGQKESDAYRRVWEFIGSIPVENMEEEKRHENDY